MEVAEHIHKANRITKSLAKCSPEDYEALIEGAMLTATHLFNAMLHAKGIRTSDKDVMHGTKLTVEDLVRCETLLGDVVKTLEFIEELRSPFVRGAEDGGVEAGALAMEKLEVIRAKTHDVI